MDKDMKKLQSAMDAARKTQASAPGTPSGKRRVPVANPKDGEPKSMRRLPGGGKTSRG